MSIDVKHHAVVQPSTRGTERRSEVADLWQPEKAIEIEGWELVPHAFADALQLAHYWRLLEACGQASESPLGGIIGRDGRMWWIDLAEPRWNAGPFRPSNSMTANPLPSGFIDRQLRRNANPTSRP